MSYKRYWWALAIVIIGSFVVLGGEGRKMISGAPPLPDVYTKDGQLLFTGSSITDGQGVWQSIGGQEIGTVWGHGAYVAPDWSADWLHRESEFLLNTWAVKAGATNFDALNVDQQAVFKARLIRDMRTNTYDASSNRVTIDSDRAAAFRQLTSYYADVFASGRSEYAIPRGALTNVQKQHQLAAFFWWTSWAASTERPNSTTTYTNNWPHEPLVANGLTSGALLWSILSIVGLLAGIGGMVWWYASQEKVFVHGPYPATDPFLAVKATPSQRATVKYFFVVVILWGIQIMMGILTAHYAVEVIAFLFTRLKLIEIRTATKAALFSTTIFLSGGIIGTFHHLYFAGATPAVIALGAIFSAFEVVPLTLVGYEAWENIRLAQPMEKAPWIANYKWPIYFFVSVAFWNLVGAGLFGFLINPPVALYYMQGLNTTPVHGHTALFGVYGMLGLGLTLFCLRAMGAAKPWKQRPLKLSFWFLNLGLVFKRLYGLA
jgi:nitric oxide reductase large subunit